VEVADDGFTPRYVPLLLYVDVGAGVASLFEAWAEGLNATNPCPVLGLRLRAPPGVGVRLGWGPGAALSGEESGHAEFWAGGADWLYVLSTGEIAVPGAGRGQDEL
jgi:hypothetical protein